MNIDNSSYETKIANIYRSFTVKLEFDIYISAPLNELYFVCKTKLLLIPSVKNNIRT